MSQGADQHNRLAWDRLAKQKSALARPARDRDFIDPQQAIDACGWLPNSIANRHVLCLAAGGGRHGPIYAAAGAIVTVIDNCPAMLELDREVAAERRLNLRTIEASMNSLSALGNGEFDIVIHPVSTCYVSDVRPVFREVARVLRPGGLYISPHKQPASLQTSIQLRPPGYYSVQHLYYGNEPLPVSSEPNLVREQGTMEFVHTWEQLLGGICRAGFCIEDVIEPMHAERRATAGTFAHRSQFLPPYIRIKARRNVTDAS